MVALGFAVVEQKQTDQDETRGPNPGGDAPVTRFLDQRRGVVQPQF
jgi:hypothetical protein